MATYTTVEDVARVLRATSGSKIRFSSEALSSIEVRDSANKFHTALTVDRANISLSDEYQGSTKLKFDFTSATEFNVFEVDSVQRFELLLGSGNISTVYSTPDSLVTVAAGTFAGTIATGDSVTLVLDAHVSTADVERFIEEAEVEVDTAMTYGGVGYLVGGAELLFEDEVPPAVKTVTTYLSAYYLYTDVFAAKFTDEKAFESSYTRRWKKRAEDMLMKYVKAHVRTVPKILSFPSYVDKFGVRGVGPGVNGLEEDEDEILRDANSEYQQDGQYWVDGLVVVDVE